MKEVNLLYINHPALMLESCGRTDCRKTNGRTDIWPKDILPNGHMAERQMTEWAYGRNTSDRKKHNAERTNG